MKHNEYFEKEYGPILCGAWCPEGWVDIVKEALKNAKALDPNLKVTQIKEKFGGLRLYVDSDDPMVNRIVADTEKKSMKVCQKCSAPGEHQTVRGWYVTMCETCKKERENYR